ncbi:response regulator transcription factor [Spartinivicinus poritis]|uniref:Response regulator transcription factor n=1 Tax=Spartinivicinus poritis TaxID=2994640 RepID=A0ABT5U6H3_9GAMM|nr:response regulator transcription factor [Spartinivicinus sp. A2-2]MDE1461966.1 response regulator transcription factor [Spartinivicinus sp. A2-2]
MITPYTIAIADDHPLFRSALKQALSQGFPEAKLLEADSMLSLQTLVRQCQNLDLILLDLMMPGADGLSGLIYLRSHHPAIPIAVVSASEDHSVIQQVMNQGAAGFIPKSAPLPLINKALTCIFNGEIWLPEQYTNQPTNTNPELHNLTDKLASLTPQQYRVLIMMTEGLLNKQIAFDLGVSEATIKAHATAIFKKLNVRNRTQAVILMKQLAIKLPELNTANAS